MDARARPPSSSSGIAPDSDAPLPRRWRRACRHRARPPIPLPTALAALAFALLVDACRAWALASADRTATPRIADAVAFWTDPGGHWARSRSRWLAFAFPALSVRQRRLLAAQIATLGPHRGDAHLHAVRDVLAGRRGR